MICNSDYLPFQIFLHNIIFITSFFKMICNSDYLLFQIFLQNFIFKSMLVILYSFYFLFFKWFAIQIICFFKIFFKTSYSSKCSWCCTVIIIIFWNDLQFRLFAFSKFSSKLYIQVNARDVVQFFQVLLLMFYKDLDKTQRFSSKCPNLTSISLGSKNHKY